MEDLLLERRTDAGWSVAAVAAIDRLAEEVVCSSPVEAARFASLEVVAPFLLEVAGPGPVEAPRSGDINLLAQLHQEVVALRHEVASLRRENLEWRQQAGYWKSRHADAVNRLAGLEQDLEHLRGEKRNLQAQLFGRKTEKGSAVDRSNQLDDPTEAKPKRRRGQQPDRPGPPRRDHSHLPAVEEVRVLPVSARVCPGCGRPLRACGTEDSVQIEIEVKAYRRVIHRQRYQRTCSCPGPRTLSAPTEPKLIAKGLLGVSVWVEILVDKFASHRPTERLLEQWRLLGLDLAAGTVADGLQRIEPLFQPIYAALTERNRQSVYVQADETRWRVFVDEQGKIGHGWWLWVFGGGDTVVYVLDPSRSHAVPQGHVSPDAAGVLLVDRFMAYKAMAQVKDGTLRLAFCWAHVRRDFVRVGQSWPELTEWALAWLRHIRELYRLNRQRLAVPADAAEGIAAAAALDKAAVAMRLQREAELADPTLAKPCRRVLESLRDHWEGLTRFVGDPRIPMDNNISERRMRGPALGRKNYYGSGALWSGRLTAALFSLLATLQHWQINPRLWLAWYLQSSAAAAGQAPTDVSPFLPWNMSPEKLHELRGPSLSPTPDSS
jgi:transposase